MTDYYQEMRDACAEIVKNAGRLCSDYESPVCSGNLHDVLEMAKWVAMDRDEAMEAYKKAIEKAVREGVAEAALKAIEQDTA